MASALRQRKKEKTAYAIAFGMPGGIVSNDSMSSEETVNSKRPESRKSFRGLWKWPALGREKQEDRQGGLEFLILKPGARSPGRDPLDLDQQTRKCPGNLAQPRAW